ncbi:Pyruvate decarboxylase 2 [Branchiostoma belcheri]|nr:Pyruvate decarboxylase 2 [Branchiostoma belcheri]
MAGFYLNPLTDDYRQYIRQKLLSISAVVASGRVLKIIGTSTIGWSSISTDTKQNCQTSCESKGESAVSALNGNLRKSLLEQNTIMPWDYMTRRNIRGHFQPHLGRISDFLVCGSEVPDGKEQLKAKADDVQREKRAQKIIASNARDRVAEKQRNKVQVQVHTVAKKFGYPRSQVSRAFKNRETIMKLRESKGSERLEAQEKPTLRSGPACPSPLVRQQEGLDDWRKRKKICLLLDNYTAHPHDVNLRNIRLIFLPANTTSIIQPLDQGIIRNFKALYRSKLMQRNDLDNGTSTAHSRYNKKDVGPMVDAVQKMFDFYKDLGIDMSKDSSVPRSRPTITTRTSWGWSEIPTHGDDVAWRHKLAQQAYCGGGGGDPGTTSRRQVRDSGLNPGTLGHYATMTLLHSRTSVREKKNRLFRLRGAGEVLQDDGYDFPLSSCLKLAITLRFLKTGNSY